MKASERLKLVLKYSDFADIIPKKGYSKQKSIDMLMNCPHSSTSDAR
jgi:hypothetical protein